MSKNWFLFSSLFFRTTWCVVFSLDKRWKEARQQICASIQSFQQRQREIDILSHRHGIIIYNQQLLEYGREEPHKMLKFRFQSGVYRRRIQGEYVSNYSSSQKSNFGIPGSSTHPFISKNKQRIQYFSYSFRDIFNA